MTLASSMRSQKLNRAKLSNLNSLDIFSQIRIKIENYSKMSLFDSKLQDFIFGIYNELLPTQNVNVARFARNVE